MASRPPLPIDPLLPEVVAAMARGNLVVVAEPGAGKTTRVPPALLELAGDRRIAVLEPRRIAARAAARRVADELGDGSAAPSATRSASSARSAPTPASST